MDVQRTKNRLLLLLKTRGPLPTKTLAEGLGISVPAVRRHLQTLGEQVIAAPISTGVGRPAQVWRLQDAAQANFPDTHSELTVQLIDSIASTLGSEALDQVIDDRLRRAAEVYRARLQGVTSLTGKLKRLVDIRCEEGYMATLEKRAEGWLLVENHCPICAAATRCRGFCKNELNLFAKLLGPRVTVERVEYLLEGDQRCAYAIQSVDENATAGRVVSP